MTLKTNRIIAATIFVACLFAGTTLVGQTPQSPDFPPRRDLNGTLRLVTPTIREDPHRAIRVLKSLEKDYPANSEVLNLLGDAYQVLGEVDSAIAAYSRGIAVNPADPRAGASLGTLYIQKGEREKGESVFRDLVAKSRPSLNAYRTIGSTLSAGGFNDMALRMYEEGRRENNNHYIFTLDIAQLQKNMGDFEASLDEYLSLIDTSPKQFPLARDRILELFQDPRADRDALIGRLAAAAAPGAHGREPVLNVLALAYLRQGMLENALEVALDAESAGGSDGKVLFGLAEQTVAEYRRQRPPEKARYFDMSLRALETFVDSHPKAPEVPRAKMLLVDLLVDVATGRMERPKGLDLETAAAKAIEALDWLIETFPGTDNAEEAYLKKGDVVLRVNKEPEQAAEIYRQGLALARYRPVQFAERLGRLYLVMGDYQNAQGYFTRLINDRDQQLRETGVYYTGLLLGYEGKYEAARDTLTALAEGNPSSAFTNDAIEFAWAIEEGLQGDQKILERYIHALKCEVAEDTSGALVSLTDITSLPAETPLRSRALFRSGELCEGSGKYNEALAAFETFARDYPTDVHVPDAHHRMGHVYEDGLNNDTIALKTYEDILLSYPHYIFLDDVREDVNRVRSKVEAHGGSS
jgi:tetratricopeptide (TPR) repeat protein